MTHIAPAFAGRVRPGLAHSADVLGAIGALANIHEKLQTKQEQLNADKNLSPQGRVRALAETVFNPAKGVGLLKDLARAGQRARVAIPFIAKQLSEFGLPKVQKDDIATLLSNMEIRSFVSTLDLAGKSAALSDPDLCDAIFSAAPALTGFTGPHRQHYEQAKIARVREMHADRIAALEAMAADYEVAAGYSKHLRHELTQVSGLNTTEFERVMVPLEAEADRRPGQPPPSANPDIKTAIDWDAVWNKANLTAAAA